MVTRRELRLGVEMRHGKRISVIIPVLNEERSIGKVIRDIPAWVDTIIVVDNGSTDQTVMTARRNGAVVVRESRRGYGSACLKGIRHLPETDIVVFLDGDYSDHPEETGLLVDPVIENRADLVIGSRVLGKREPGALSPQARFGNLIACYLIRYFWRVRFTDLGPFRAIRRSSLEALDMRDPDYGWTVEMQIKAAMRELRCVEVPVKYRKRIGISKVSGTISGILGAGTKIIGTIIFSVWKKRKTG